MDKVFIIAEIGINHNGLIDQAAAAGCNAVKFQKRTLEEVYTKADLDRPRESPWGTTNRQQKEGLEFGKEEYDIIDRHCKEVGIEWLASAWDLKSQKIMQQYDLNYNKVASAMLTHRELLEEIASEGKHTFISTGMSTLEEISKAIHIFKEKNCPFELMHCNSTYPLQPEDANLSLIPELSRYFGVPIGYSGHESGIAISMAAVALGATSLERHITLDRTMYGSDQAASIEYSALQRLVQSCRKIQVAMGNPVKIVTESEIACKNKLRIVDTL